MPGERFYLVILKQFVPVGPDEVDRVLSAVSAATCQLEPCPSWLMKACRMVTARKVKAQVNSSLQEGTFPGHFKEVLVHSLFKKKKKTIDPTCWDNFHPVFHLVEKVVACPLQRVMDETDYLHQIIRIHARLWDRDSIGCTCQ